MEILILLVLIFVNGLFVMSEIALVSARKSRLEHLADKGDHKALRALKLSNSPEKFLSAAQIGITLIAIFTGVYSGEKFSENLSPYLEKIPFLKEYAKGLSTTLIVMLVTFLSIIFGELIPKQLGLLRAERIARIVAAPMNTFASITHPIVWLLNKISVLFFRIFNIRKSKDDAITEEEIKTLIVEGTEAGTIEEAEQEIIERVFHLGDRSITSLMTHRSDIIWFNLDDNEEKIKVKILQEPHSAYPICDGSIDNIKGIVSIKDLYISPDNTLFRDIMVPALFIPENNSPYQVMEKFKQSKIHSAFLVDEYGSILGLLTLNDILEAIVGDIPQTDVPEYEIRKRDDGTYLVDGQIPFYNFLVTFEKADWMNEEEHDFDTLAGFVLHELERIPSTGDKIEWKGFKIEVVDMDGHRIDKLLVSLSDQLKEDIED
ncbi:MAG: HlyC/CorC family transporter [Chitinophagaceae bacterium]|nr:HlyC/CorC family transporter [Chitinophagaceae bacterium]